MPHYAVVDAAGQLVSEGATVADADALRDRGLTAVEVDGPPRGRVWDTGARAFREPTDAERDRADPGRAHRRRVDELVAAARQSGATTDAKLTALLELLAGPPAPAAPAPTPAPAPTGGGTAPAPAGR